MSGIPQTYLMAVFLFGADNSSNSSEQLLQGWEMLAGGGREVGGRTVLLGFTIVPLLTVYQLPRNDR